MLVPDGMHALIHRVEISRCQAFVRCIAKLPKKPELHDRVRNAYWAALDQAGSAADGEARLRALVGKLQTDYPSAAACLAEDLPALCVHLGYPLRLRKRLRSTNLLVRSLGEVKRRTKVIGRFPGETSCLSLLELTRLRGHLDTWDQESHKEARYAPEVHPRVPARVPC